MPKKEWIKKVLVIGSGPIVIGQAAEFDYAGTQACRVLKEEGLEVVLVNSNPATIMTDTDIADKVYLEPLTVESIERIIARERPDSLLAGLGGQTGLNMAMELDERGILEKYNVQLLGTKIDAIRRAEDREDFKNMMLAIGEPCIDSVIVHDVQPAVDFASEHGVCITVICGESNNLGALGNVGIKLTCIGPIEKVIRLHKPNSVFLLTRNCHTPYGGLAVFIGCYGEDLGISAGNLVPDAVNTRCNGLGDKLALCPGHTAVVT